MKNSFVKWSIWALLIASPYLGIGYLFKSLNEGSWNAFWVAIGVAVALRFSAALSETAIDEVWWRLEGRATMIDTVDAALAANNFPNPTAMHPTYFCYIQEVIAGAQSDELRKCATEEYRAMATVEPWQGPLQRVRYHSALDAGLRKYAKRFKT